MLTDFLKSNSFHCYEKGSIILPCNPSPSSSLPGLQRRITRREGIDYLDERTYLLPSCVHLMFCSPGSQFSDRIHCIRPPIIAENSENSRLFYVSWSKSIRIVGQQMAVPWHLLGKLRGKSKRIQIENQMII